MGFLGARIKMGNPMFPTQDVDQQTGILMTETYDIPVTYPKRSFLLVTQIDPEMFVGVTHLSPPVDLNQFVGCTLDQNLGTSTSLQFWMFIPFIWEDWFWSFDPSPFTKIRKNPILFGWWCPNCWWNYSPPRSLELSGTCLTWRGREPSYEPWWADLPSNGVAGEWWLWIVAAKTEIRATSAGSAGFLIVMIVILCRWSNGMFLLCDDMTFPSFSIYSYLTFGQTGEGPWNPCLKWPRIDLRSKEGQRHKAGWPRKAGHFVLRGIELYTLW